VPSLDFSILNSLVGADTGSFEGFRAQLFVLVGDHVDAEREFVDIGALSAEIEDSVFWLDPAFLLESLCILPDLSIGHTTVEPRLGVGLYIGSVCILSL
jgi:hypothetical protein